jgi:hypothetical protein
MGLGLFHFDDHVALGEHLLGGVDHRGPGREVQVISQANRISRSGFNQNSVACAHQLSDAGRRHADPEFLCFDFFWDAQLHGVVSGNEFGGILPSSAEAKKVKNAFLEPKKSLFSTKNDL